ncbi:hypothetical protein ACQQ91_11015 [Selenomonas bovis]|uniref:hypothetical protein n=1 Tax=Selenomonas bovis TaxID=416586 RepID=UPI003D020BF3
MMMPELREKRERFWKWVKIYLLQSTEDIDNSDMDDLEKAKELARRTRNTVQATDILSGVAIGLSLANVIFTTLRMMQSK